jgi:hypothetical protein
MRGKSYDRFNYNLGLAWFERGFIQNPVALADDMGNLLEWRKHADRNAFEYFARAYTSGKLLAAGARLASVLALRGQVGKAVVQASSVANEALVSSNRLDLCDVVLASVPVYDIARLPKMIQGAAQLQNYCITIARELGDEPRRALLCSHLGRFLTYLGQLEPADEFLNEAERIASRLDLQQVVLVSNAARGRWLTDSGKSDQAAIELFKEVLSKLQALDDEPLYGEINVTSSESNVNWIKGRNPLRCRVLLDMCKAAGFAGDEDALKAALGQLDEITPEHVLGYYPHYALAHAQCLIAYGQPSQRPLVLELLRNARQIGTESQNPWVSLEADRLESHLIREE